MFFSLPHSFFFSPKKKFLLALNYITKLKELEFKKKSIIEKYKNLNYFILSLMQQ